MIQALEHDRQGEDAKWPSDPDESKAEFFAKGGAAVEGKGEAEVATHCSTLPAKG